MRAALSEIRRNPVSILFESQTQLRTNPINLGGVLEQPAIWNQPLIRFGFPGPDFSGHGPIEGPGAFLFNVNVCFCL